ncbi:MAG: MFS transporter [Balneolales bacterium]|nr:MFS transporter [Balneolales bacterium]
MSLHQNKTVERVYEILTEEDERSCEAIPESACREAPGNFLLNSLNGAATKLAEQIASPSLVLPWLLGAMGAPPSLSGFLVPLHKGGSLIPQLSVSGRIRKFARRKWFWVGAGTVQALALLLMAAAAFLLDGLAGGIAVLGLLLIFSLASGVGSVSFKDVLAKTIPKGKRGTLLSVRATTGGLLSLGAGFVLHRYLGEGEDIALYVWLLLTAAALWFGAALLFALIREEDGATAGGRNALQEAKAGWKLIKEQPFFARLVLARGLLLSVMLVIPFYALLAREVTGTAVSSLGIFVIASSLASVLSSYFWGRFADRSSRLVMAAGGAVGMLGCALALSFLLFPESWQTPWAFAAVFFIGGMAQAGTRLGRKTYIVDAAPEADRPLYVAVSNTLIGLVTLSSAVLGFVADLFGTPWLIGLFALIMLAGILTALSLPEAENMVKAPG